MSDEGLQCPKCKGEMIQGFVGDQSDGNLYVAGWHAGQPKKSFWFGAKSGHSEALPIGAFRCQKCGFLEFYSDRRFEAH